MAPRIRERGGSHAFPLRSWASSSKKLVDILAKRVAVHVHPELNTSIHQEAVKMVSDEEQ